MAFDTFVGLPLDQSVAGAAWDNGGISWSTTNTFLVGNGADAVKMAGATTDIIGNYDSLPGKLGAAVFFKVAPGRNTSVNPMRLIINAQAGATTSYKGSGVMVSVGAYGYMEMIGLGTSPPAAASTPQNLIDGQEYCLEVYKTNNPSGLEYKAKVYLATSGVRGALQSTVTYSRGVTVPDTDLHVQLASQTSPLVTINRVETVDNEAADSVAPTLSSPTVTATSSSALSGTVSTNEGNGTLYFLAATSATATAAEVKAGGSQAVTATGTQTVSITGRAGSTTYYLHFLHRDAGGNDSAVVSSSAVTTPALVDTTAPTFAAGAAITPGTITTTSIAGSYPAATDNVAVTGYQVSYDSGATWVANGTNLTFSKTGLSASTTVPVWVRAFDAASPPNYSTPLQTTMATAAAAGSFVTDAWTSSGTLRANQAYTGTWYSGGAPGTAGGTATVKSGTLSAAGVATISGLPAGSGFFIGATSDGGRFYQEGTVA